MAESDDKSLWNIILKSYTLPVDPGMGSLQNFKGCASEAPQA